MKAFDEASERDKKAGEAVQAEKRCVDCKHVDVTPLDQPCIDCLMDDDRPSFEYRLGLL